MCNENHEVPKIDLIINNSMHFLFEFIRMYLNLKKICCKKYAIDFPTISI